MSLLWCTILASVLLQTKHLVIDWIWQPPYEHLNKGTFGHFGGIRHAGKNALGTGLALCLGFSPAANIAGPFLVMLVLLDFIVHYLIDWSKVNLNRRFCLCPLQHPQFWWLTGIDQYLHQITYLGLMALVLVRLS